MKKADIPQTKYTSYALKIQNLNEEKLTMVTGNIPSDNENPFVKSERSVPDVSNFHGNGHATGAGGTRDSHVTEVADCQMQASQNERGAQLKADIGFPTPPPTPQKTLSNGKTAFPLFDSLLREGVNEQLNQPATRTPATAPILINTSKHCQSTEIRVQSPTKNNQLNGSCKTNSDLIVNLRFNDKMDEKELEERKEQITKAVEEAMKGGKVKQDEENIQPITLQDPPKPKLKRQLSIGTVETTERQRSPKRSYVPKNLPPARTICTEQSWVPYIDPKPDEVDGDSTTVRDTAQPKHDREANSSYQPVITCQKSQAFAEPPLQSPHYFNMKDIELTSPFLNPIPYKGQQGNENIFVFPESKDQRISPAKPSPSKSVSSTVNHVSVPATSVRYQEPHEVIKSMGVISSNETQRTATGSVSQAGRSYSLRYTESDQSQRKPDYVTQEGFKWPKTANVTEPIPFSPRVVTAGINPNFPMTQQEATQRARQTEEIEKLQERITLLEREYERAKEIYSSKPVSQRDFSPCSRELQEILRRGALRSISDIDRSPNEKDIRRINEEVKSRYERSVSDPTFSPRQRQQRFIAQPSPLGRQNTCRPDDVNDVKDSQASFRAQSLDRWNDLWLSDARRQLFSREDIQPSFDPLPTPSPESVFLEDIQLPEEVANFFHSRSFHPEDLENLKGILKRSQDQQQQHQPASGKGQPVDRRTGATMSLEMLQSQLSPNGSYGDRERHNLLTFDNVRRFIGSPLLANTYGDASRPVGTPLNRDRKIGDIDVRISCEGITEKVRQAKEILKDLDHNTKDCQCALIEQDILTMTNEAFARIRRMDTSKESFMRFSEELTEANTNVCKSLEILCGIKCMCKYGRTLDEIYSGSIVFKFNCPNIYALDDLWESYKSGDLEKLIKKTFVTKELKDKFNADDIQLKVTISWEEYKQCKFELEMIDNGIVRSVSSIRSSLKMSSPLAVTHCRSRSEPIVNSVSSCCSVLHKPTMSPFRERICSDSTVELSPRRAFQEINVGKESRLSVSPSRKSLLDIFAEYDPKRSPKLSPRRKSFGIKSPWEHENIQPENFGSSEAASQRISDV